jgi:antitoxin VapB
MQITKVFKSGNSQAVRIPVELQFDTDEVEIFRRDDELILRKKPATLAKAFHLHAQLPDDFMIDRSDEPAQERSDL